MYVPIEKKFGTKLVFLIGASISTASIVIFIVTNILQPFAPWLKYLSLVALCSIIFGNRLGPQVTMHGLLAELTTAASRPTVSTYTGNIFWINAAVISIVLPYSVAAWNAYAYIPFAVLSLGVVTFVAIAVPDTYNRTTAQIQQSISKRSSRMFPSSHQDFKIPSNTEYHSNPSFDADQ